jgi:diguanylate cyclase (GGDEF)-like protein/PAS domain S-box-containing protein
MSSAPPSGIARIVRGLLMKLGPQALALTGSADEGRLRAARVAALFRVAMTAYATTATAGGILMVILWGPFTAEVLMAWFGVLVAWTLARLWLHRAYLRDPRRLAPERWEARFALGALGGGAIWAFAVAVFFPPEDLLLQMAVMFVVGGTLIGATGVYAPSPLAFYGFSALPLIAVLLQLAQQPGRTYQLLALMTLVFGAAMLRVFRDIHHSVVGTLRAQLEKEDLLERVARSEARLRDAIESLPEGIAVYDAEDRLAVCNEAYARVYGGGKSAAQLLGTAYREVAETAWEAELVPGEYAGRREAWLEERIAKWRAGDGVAHQVALRDGRHLLAQSVRSGGGIVRVFTDVTELTRAQDQYRSVLAEENLMLDTLPVGVVFVAGRVIVRCNRALERMLGYKTGELNGRSMRALYASREGWEAAGESYARLRTGATAEGEAELARKDGSRLWCRGYARALDPGAPDENVVAAFSDVTERRASRAALRKSEAMYRSLVETSGDLIWSTDRDGRWTYLNPAAAQRIYGRSPAELLGREFREILAPEVRERDVAVFGRILAGEAVFEYETRHLRADGTHVDLSLNAIPLRDASGETVGATGTAHDVTREKAAAAALHESVEKLRLAVEAADLVYWEWDRDTDLLQWGRDPSTLGMLEGRTRKWTEYRDLVHPEDRERYVATVRSAWEHAGVCESQYRVLGREGRVTWIATRGKTLMDAKGRITRMIGVSQDVTEAKRQEEETRFLAYHDTLTGLPNRRLLDDRLRQVLYLAQRRDLRVAVMMIDLDRFKQVNDALGHRAGDAVLREAAHRLGGCVRKADTLARHGGDEFVVVLADLQLESDCQVVAEKVLRSLEPPFVVDGREFVIGASIGISLYPADAGDGEALLRNADAAMYRAKQLGRSNYRFYGR